MPVVAAPVPGALDHPPAAAGAVRAAALGVEDIAGVDMAHPFASAIRRALVSVSGGVGGTSSSL